MNANLQHGQLFQAADGRLFTLAQSSQAVQAVREVSPNHQQQSFVSVPANEPAVEAVRVVPSRDVGVASATHALGAVGAIQGARFISNSQAAPLNQAVRFVTANQAVNTVPAAQAFRVVPANQNVAVVPASTEAFRVVPATQSVPAIKAVRGGAGHLLADPNTSVYTGFFSNPGAGFGFNF